jgi:hypothetical protein
LGRERFRGAALSVAAGGYSVAMSALEPYEEEETCKGTSVSAGGNSGAMRALEPQRFWESVR